MEIVLVDWTQMGEYYCLAGAIRQAGCICFVRPLPVRTRESPSTFNGWPSYRMNGRSRWEIFEMVDPVPHEVIAPHLEDVSVQDLRPRRQSASPEARRAILQAGIAPSDKPIFGVELTQTQRGVCYVAPGTGERSLATVMSPSKEIHFTAHQSEGSGESKYHYHVRLNLPGHGEAILAVKDYSLLCQAAQQATDLDSQV